MFEVFLDNKIALSPQTVIDAYETGSDKLIQKIIESKLFLFNRLKEGKTQLHLACIHGRPTFVDQLLLTNLNKKIKDDYGNTPFHYACENGNYLIISKLYQHGAGISVLNEPNNIGLSPLCLVCSNKDLTALTWLSETCEPKKLYPPFYYACTSGYWHAALKLYALMEKKVKSSKHADLLKNQLFKGILGAASFGQIATVEELLKKCDHDPSAHKEQLIKCLNIAVQNNHLELFKSLFFTSQDLAENKLVDELLIKSFSGNNSQVSLFLIKNKKESDFEKMENGSHFFLKLACENKVPKDVVLEIVHKIKISNLTLEDLYYLSMHEKSHLIFPRFNANVKIVDFNRYILKSTLLHSACHENAIGLVEYLIDKKVDLEATDENGRTALHNASLLGHIDIVKILCKNGAQIDSVKNLMGFGTMPIMLAAENDHLDTVAYFYKRYKKVGEKLARTRIEDAVRSALKNQIYSVPFYMIEEIGFRNLLTYFIWELLCHACSGKEELDSVKIVLPRILNNIYTTVPFTIFTKITESGSTLFHLASKIPNDKEGYVLNEFINYVHKVQPDRLTNCLNTAEKDGNTPLHLAVVAESLPCVIKLIRNGGNVTLQNGYGKTPLDLDHNFVLRAFVKSLIKKNLQTKDLNSKYRLLMACQGIEQSLDPIRRIIEAMTTEELSSPIYNGKTYLHIACQNKNQVMAKALLDEGVLLNQKDDSKRYPLHWACEGKLHQIAKEILDQNSVGFDEEDVEKQTPLFLACRAGLEEIAMTLLQKTKDIKSQSYLLHVALDAKMPRIVQKLIDLDVNCDILDEEGHHPPIVFAVENSFRNIAEQLYVKMKSEKELGMHQTRSGTQLFVLACEKEMFSLALELLINSKKQADLISLILRKNKALYSRLFHYTIKENITIKNDDFSHLIDNNDFPLINSTPLHQALLNDNIEWAQEYIEQGLYIDEKDDQKRSALHIICEKELETIFDELIYRALPDQELMKELLEYACKGRSERIIKKILRKSDISSSIALQILHNAHIEDLRIFFDDLEGFQLVYSNSLFVVKMPWCHKSQNRFIYQNVICQGLISNDLFLKELLLNVSNEDFSYLIDLLKASILHNEDLKKEIKDAFNGLQESGSIITDLGLTSKTNREDLRSFKKFKKISGPTKISRSDDSNYAHFDFSVPTTRYNYKDSTGSHN